MHSLISLLKKKTLHLSKVYLITIPYFILNWQANFVSCLETEMTMLFTILCCYNISEFTKMAVFQFMIGNTDWSVPYLHNIRLMCKDSASVPCTVPYDFDYAGIVNTRYAIPTPELGIVSVQQRLYLGYCLADKKELDEIFTLFNNLKNDFYNVYINCSLLNPKYVKTKLNYLDDFYKIINNKKAIDTEFGAPCGAQGKVVIKRETTYDSKVL